MLSIRPALRHRRQHTTGAGGIRARRACGCISCVDRSKVAFGVTGKARPPGGSRVAPFIRGLEKAGGTRVGLGGHGDGGL